MHVLIQIKSLILCLLIQAQRARDRAQHRAEEAEQRKYEINLLTKWLLTFFTFFMYGQILIIIQI